MQEQRVGDVRTGPRRPFEGVVQVSWQARSGETKMIRAKCLDLSSDGARIECAQPIDVRTNVYLQAPAFGLMGNASVRYCRRSKMKHIVGLLFSSATSQADRGRQRCLDKSATENGETTSHES
jgi:hypothetical protein